VVALTTFALVHGSMGGGWCWEDVRPLLEERGHRVIAVDLPCDDGNATLDDYAATVCDACSDVDDALVVVGHSLGGATIPLVAAKRPVARLIYLAALIPSLGVSLGSVFAERGDLVPVGMMGDMVPVGDGGAHILPPDRAVHWFFHDCDPAVAQRAAARLRPQSSNPMSLPYPLTEWPDVPVTYIQCDADRCIPAGWADVARDQFGVEPIVIPGGHSAFHRDPAGLVGLLSSFASG
jgi:pimeloyl-ACP methyl ester carboxylesterase